MSTGRWRDHPGWVLGLASTLAAFLLFARSGLVGDDTSFLLRYVPTVHGWEESWRLPPAFRDWFGPLHRPLSILSWKFDLWLWGDRWWGHHLMQALFYGAGVGAFAAFCAVWFRLLGPHASSARRRRAVWLATALYALHPVHVECAAWLATRHDVLYGALMLAALALAGHALESHERRRLWLRGMGAALLLGLAVQAKESAYAGFPILAFLLLLALWRASRGRTPLPRGREVLAALLLPAFLVGLASLYFRSVSGLEAAPAWHPEALARWAGALGWALRQSLLPEVPRLFYLPPPPAWWIGPALPILLVWGVLGLRRAPRNLLPLAGLGFALLSLAPTWMVAWQALMTTTVADRYLLLPVGGSLMALAMPLCEPRPLARALTSAALLGCLVVGGIHAWEWAGPPRRLGLATARRAPESLAARTLGVSRCLRHDDLAGAEEIYALQPPPRERPGQEGKRAALRALLFSHEGRFPEAVAEQRHAVEARPRNPSRWHDLGALLWSEFQSLAASNAAHQAPKRLLLEAEDAFREALRLDPRNFRSAWLLGNVEASLGRMEEARKAFERATASGPGSREAELAKRALARLRAEGH